MTKEELEKAQMIGALTEMKQGEFNETNSLLEKLRRKRKAEGGSGAPLVVPMHLRDASAGRAIIVTDADLDPKGPQISPEVNSAINRASITAQDEATLVPAIDREG